MSTTVHTASEKKAPHQQRSEETRDALIGAGLELFGENGFNATTTRMVASRAGANIAAIPYYFGGKKGLYHAVVEHIMMRADSHLGETRTAIMAQMQAE